MSKSTARQIADLQNKLQALERQKKQGRTEGKKQDKK